MELHDQPLYESNGVTMQMGDLKVRKPLVQLKSGAEDSKVKTHYTRLVAEFVKFSLDR